MCVTRRIVFSGLAVLTVLAGVLRAQDVAPKVPGRYRIDVRSTADSTLQPSYLYVPERKTAPAPLAVMLHTWSYDLEQRDTTVEHEAAKRGWLLLAPNFRGRNDHPGACGSPAAQQDILDAVTWVRSHYAVDGRRIYLLGLSGGGYMTMLMASRHPEPWAAASAWVGISDLNAWYTTHAGDRYGEMMRSCFGDAPGPGNAVEAEMRTRSPVTSLHRKVAVPMDLAAGRFDSTVAPSHTLRAFQLIAPGAVSDAEIEALLAPGTGLPKPSPVDTARDATFAGRRIYLRRRAGPHRLTIFEGGHEWLPSASVAWLARQRRATP